MPPNPTTYTHMHTRCTHTSLQFNVLFITDPRHVGLPPPRHHVSCYYYTIFSENQIICTPSQVHTAHDQETWCGSHFSCSI